jgi:sRNA-binding protein
MRSEPAAGLQGQSLEATGRGHPSPPYDPERASFFDALAEILGGDAAVPAAISKERTKALKIGVDADLLKRFPEADEDRLKDWLSGWVNSRTYLRALAYKKHRHDLDGNDVNKISESDRNFAAWMLRGMKRVDPILGRPKTAQELRTIAKEDLRKARQARLEKQKATRAARVARDAAEASIASMAEKFAAA